MAKRKTGKALARSMAKGSKRPPLGKSKSKPGGSRSGSTARKRGLRQQPLGGMEDVRIKELDDVAADIADDRKQMNELRTQEGEDLNRALKLMKKHLKQTWRAHGVELVRVPGEEKLRVRTSREQATGEVEGEQDVPDEQDIDQDTADQEAEQEQGETLGDA